MRKDLLVLILIIILTFMNCASFPDPVDEKSSFLVGHIDIQSVKSKAKYGIMQILLSGKNGSTFTLTSSDITPDGYFLIPNIKPDEYFITGIQCQKLNFYLITSSYTIYSFQLLNYPLKVREGRINYAGHYNIKVMEFGNQYTYVSTKKKSLELRGKAINNIIKFHPDSEWSEQAHDRLSEIDQSYALYKKAQARYKEKKYDEAFKMIDAALKIVRDCGMYYNMRGLVNQIKKEYSLALIDFNEAIEFNPTVPDFYYNRGRTFELKKDEKSAIQEYLKSELYLHDFNKYIAPKNALDYYMIARAYLEDEKPDYNTAINNLKKSLAMTKNFASAHYTMAYCYNKQKKYKKTIDSYKEYLKLNPEHITVYHYIGNQYLYLKDYDKAIESYSQPIEKGKDQYESYAERSFCWFKKENYQNAMDDILKAIQIHNKAGWLFVYQGRILIMQNKLKEAVDSYTKAIHKSDNKDFRAYYYRGLANKKLNKNVEAEEDLQRAEELNESNLSYEYNTNE